MSSYYLLISLLVPDVIIPNTVGTSEKLCEPGKNITLGDKDCKCHEKGHAIQCIEKIDIPKISEFVQSIDENVNGSVLGKSIKLNFDE